MYGWRFGLNGRYASALAGKSFFFFQAEDGIRDVAVTGVQTCALPISRWRCARRRPRPGHAPRRGWRSPRPPSDSRSWPRPRPDRPASWPRSRGTAALRRSRWLRPGVAAPALYRREDAAQDVDLVLIELGALQEAPDASHQVRAALGAGAELDLLQHLREVRVQARHFLRARERRPGRCARRSALAGAEQLVRHQLHRHGEIQ